MSNKMTCPVCGSHTSSVWMAYGSGEPCPHCDAPSKLMAEVSVLRDRADARRLNGLNAEIVTKLEDAETALVVERAHRSEALTILRQVVDDLVAAVALLDHQ